MRNGARREPASKELNPAAVCFLFAAKLGKLTNDNPADGITRPVDLQLDPDLIAQVEL